MPEYAFLTLIISLSILGLGLSFKLAETSHLLKLANKEIDGFIEQITSLKKEHENIISSSSKLHNAEINRVSERYQNHIGKIHKVIDDFIEHRQQPPLLGLQGLNYYNQND